MIPTRINLLDQDKKKYIISMINYYFIKNIFELILISIILISISTIGARYILEEYYNDIKKDIDIVNKKQIQINDKIKKINKTFANAQNIQKQFKNWSKIIIDISNNLPDNIKLNSLKLNNQQQTIYIGGLAKTRQDLLDLKNNLENLEYIETIDIPLSELTKTENFKFSLELNISQ